MEDPYERLAENKVLPSHHLVDKGSVDAETGLAPLPQLWSDIKSPPVQLSR